MRGKIRYLALVLALVSLTSPGSAAAVQLSAGGTLYVPIYRNFYQMYGSSKDTYGLTSTASLHNTDPKHTITVQAVEHYDSNGKLLKSLLFEPIAIKPWCTKEITLPPSVQAEDFGSNLIVRWKADQPVNRPLVEVLMVGFMLNRGVSFLTRGQEIKE